MPQRHLSGRVVCAQQFIKAEVVVAEEIPEIDEEGQMQPAPLVLEDRREQQKDGEDKVEDREDAHAAPREEALEEVRIVACIEQNSCNEKAGEDKEEIDARPAALPYLIDDLQYLAAVRTTAEVGNEDHRHSKCANAIQSGKPGCEVDGGEVAYRDGQKDVLRWVLEGTGRRRIGSV